MRTKIIISMALLFALAQTLLAQTADTYVTQGRAFLSATNIGAANNSFSNAVRLSPNHQTGNAFYAATRLLVLPSQPAGSNFLSRIGLPLSGRDIYNWTAKFPNNGNGSLLVPAGVNANEFTAILRTNVLPALIAAQANLAKVTDTNFTLTLTSNETRSVGVTLDYGDTQMVRAMIQGAEYFIYTTYSWNLDAQLAAINSLNTNHQLSIERLLSDYPNLLTFSTTNDLNSARIAFQNGVDSYTLASQIIRNRATNVIRLFNYDAGEATKEQNFRLTMTDLRNSMASAVTMVVDTNYMVYMGSHFSGTHSVRSLLPSFRANAFGLETLPDPTFGGLIGGVTGQGVDDFLAKFLFPIQNFVATPGTAVAWGSNDYGETNIPVGLSGLTAIAAGALYTVALKSDGTVLAWGNNDYGQTNVPVGLSKVLVIAAGGLHTVALKSDGSLVGWGDNTFGQISGGVSGVRAIAAGGYHTVALKKDGRVVAWGYNLDGQANVPASLGYVRTIAAGGYHTVALKKDGTVAAWGNNDYGQTNVPVGLSGVTAIAAGGYHTVALKSDGTVVAWGAGTTNPGVFPEYGQSIVPIGLNRMTAIAAGGYHTVALKSDGTVLAWGVASGVDSFGQASVPTGLSRVTAIAAGALHSVALVRPVSPLAPVITLQPQSQTVVAGANVTFNVTATGAAPLRYQWREDDVDLQGGPVPSLTINRATIDKSGRYTVVVSNSAGSATSDPAFLFVVSSLFQPPSSVDAQQIKRQGFNLNFTVEALVTNYLIDVSMDLSSPANWIPLTNFSGSDGVFQFLDRAATNYDRRFYRIRRP